MSTRQTTKDLQRLLNERIKTLLEEGKIPLDAKVKVGWNEDRAFWAEFKKGKWRLRSGPVFPKRCLTPRELNVDLGVYVCFLSGEAEGSVSSMM